MPCHVPSASVPRVRRAPSLSVFPVAVIATLDLADPNERAAHDLIRRSCSGRWPLWRLLGMRRAGRTLHVAVEWLRCRRHDRYSVVQVALGQQALSWTYFPSATAAQRGLAMLIFDDGQHQVTG